MRRCVFGVGLGALAQWIAACAYDISCPKGWTDHEGRCVCAGAMGEGDETCAADDAGPLLDAAGVDWASDPVTAPRDAGAAPVAAQESPLDGGRRAWEASCLER